MEVWVECWVETATMVETTVEESSAGAKLEDLGVGSEAHWEELVWWVAAEVRVVLVAGRSSSPLPKAGNR